MFGGAAFCFYCRECFVLWCSKVALHAEVSSFDDSQGHFHSKSLAAVPIEPNFEKYLIESS